MLLGRVLYVMQILSMTATTKSPTVNCGLLNSFNIILASGALKSCESWLFRYA